jgi:CubicO group peptidase (beta-lactamase class C family)
MKLNLIVFISLLYCTIQINAQQNDIVQNQGIVSPLHQANIGKIIFTSESVPLEELKETDFLNTYELTNKSNLFITVFMGNSVTNYMHEIAPELSASELVKSGNYQFTLFVDNHLIYKSNLFPGAPYARIQDTATVICKPLIDNRNPGVWWSQFFWGRFMNHGGDSALTEGKHLLKMEIRAYVKQGSDLKEGIIIASGSLNLFVMRKPVINIAKIRLNKPDPYKGFEVSSESFDKDLMKTLKGNIDEGVFKNISSIIVIKNGKLLIEEYFNGETRDSLHDPRSVGKSFASTVTGIAESEGYLKNEDQTLKEFYDIKSFANYSAEKENVSIKDLLTMSSVFDGNDDDDNSPGNEENMYPTENWVKFALDLPVNLTRPKDEWHYFTAGAVVLGDILNKTVPGGLEKYADLKLFNPLGITKYQWQHTPQGVANTAGGIRMNALDFAKYGQLYKNNGRWNGKQIIPEEWVKKTFTKYKSIPGRKDEFYGYLFWNKKYIVKDKAYETFYCAGNGGNKIYVFTDQPLVIVITATAYGASYAHSQEDKMMTDYILPAILVTKTLKIP